MSDRKHILEYVAVSALLFGVAAMTAQRGAPPALPDHDTPEWLGVPIKKTPSDLWVLEEIVFKVRPDVVVEAGTYKGGSALYFASLQELMGRGQVISIDIKDWQHKPAHHRITYLVGSSISPLMVEQVRHLIQPHQTVLVDLDSDHSMNHVLEELRAYAPLVSVGSYVIVEDTQINADPLGREFAPGPRRAVEEFLAGNRDFVVDHAVEKYPANSSPGGYLRRVARQEE